MTKIRFATCLMSCAGSATISGRMSAELMRHRTVTKSESKDEVLGQNVK